MRSDVLLKELPISSRPRERFIKYGAENLSDEELLAIILRCGYKNVNVKNLSLNILKEVGGIKNLKDVTINELINIKGIGLTKAISLISSIEFGKRVYMSNDETKIKLNNSYKIFNYFKKEFYDKLQEQLLVVYLDKSFNLIDYRILFKGTIDSSLIHPREIFKYAVKTSSSYFVLIHNHPSGNLEPSNDDIVSTENINTLSKLMGIKLLDHIILHNDNYVSLKELGIFK